MPAWPFRIFIKEAGVAGASLAAIAGLDCCCAPPLLAVRYGDLLAELDLGVAGGGIKISDRGSGDTESAPELSWL